jgi:ribulose-5-phosphate 4-epimerase/fuculose-1-phosphate aldolase
MLETCCDILVDAYKRNWITSRDGNISIRHHDRDHFYITPSGVRKQTMQPDQFKKIKLVDSISAIQCPPFLTKSWQEKNITQTSVLT